MVTNGAQCPSTLRTMPDPYLQNHRSINESVQNQSLVPVYCAVFNTSSPGSPANIQVWALANTVIVKLTTFNVLYSGTSSTPVPVRLLPPPCQSLCLCIVIGSTLLGLYRVVISLPLLEGNASAIQHSHDFEAIVKAFAAAAKYGAEKGVTDLLVDVSGNGGGAVLLQTLWARMISYHLDTPELMCDAFNYKHSAVYDYFSDTFTGNFSSTILEPFNLDTVNRFLKLHNLTRQVFLYINPTFGDPTLTAAQKWELIDEQYQVWALNKDRTRARGHVALQPPGRHRVRVFLVVDGVMGKLVVRQPL